MRVRIERAADGTLRITPQGGMGGAVAPGGPTTTIARRGRYRGYSFRQLRALGDGQHELPLRRDLPPDPPADQDE
jgi:hypothetical protein